MRIIRLKMSPIQVVSTMSLVEFNVINSKVSVPQGAALRGVPAQEEIAVMQPCCLGKAQRRLAKGAIFM